MNIAARAVGIAQESYNQALAYSKERKAFGKEISKHQAIAFKLADMATEIEAARLLCLKAAWLKGLAILHIVKNANQLKN